MTRRAHRRLRLPADHRTPAIARAAVRQVLTAGGRTAQIEEALLLVSELSTNGVVHAGSAVDIEVLADEHGVTITVSDEATGPVAPFLGPHNARFDPISAPGPPASVPPEAVAPDPGAGGPVRGDPVVLSERGRGLLLVEALATEWGTRHWAGGKSVWCRLGPVEHVVLGDPLG